jgi:16S rRNA A1518/A1519 N6-dimethyltransferase RsmA/KsgA/DIM1 with predicted DNA glycosylase/AP lyase activity
MSQNFSLGYANRDPLDLQRENEMEIDVVRAVEMSVFPPRNATGGKSNKIIGNLGYYISLPFLS